MMRKKTCVAMLLAGGQGSRLGILTKRVAKPAVPYGGKYRIIDFPLFNCTNSGIDTVGVLTQYQPLELNAYIGSGAPWDLDLTNGGGSNQGNAAEIHTEPTSWGGFPHSLELVVPPLATVWYRYDRTEDAR